jgi:hypothetical protein
LAISEREADQALAGLRESMGEAVTHIQAAIQSCGNAENCERLMSLVTLAKDYAATAVEMTAEKKDYGDIAKPKLAASSSSKRSQSMPISESRPRIFRREASNGRDCRLATTRRRLGGGWPSMIAICFGAAWIGYQVQVINKEKSALFQL